MTRFLLMLLLCAAVSVVGEESSGSARRRFSDYQSAEEEIEAALIDLPNVIECEKSQCPQCPQSTYEPLLSFGEYFLARTRSTPERSLVAAYTKNGTILVFTLTAFSCGVLLGVALALGLPLKRIYPRVDESTTEKQQCSPAAPNPSSNEDKSRQPRETTGLSIEGLHLDETELRNREPNGEEENEEPDAAFEDMWVDLRTPVKRDTQRKVKHSSCSKNNERSPEQRRVITETPGSGDEALVETDAEKYTSEVQGARELNASIQKLTACIHETAGPISAVAAYTQSLATDIGDIKWISQWTACRKAKKDLWVSATDNMSYGMLLMNLSLAVCAGLYGRWQDWGLQCDIRYFNWSIHSLLAMVWCLVEEQCIFAVGCGLWWFTMRYACSAPFLKRKQPLSTVLLSLTLVCTGIIHSFTVALLGGSWIISFSVWLLYSMFLIQALESVKDSLFEGNASGASGLVSNCVKNSALSAVMAVVLFPVLAGALPFWNVGLSFALSAAVKQSAFAMLHHTGQMAQKFMEYLLY